MSSSITLEHCQFVDLWTGSRFVREDNPKFVWNGDHSTLGKVWRGPPHQPEVVFTKYGEQ